MNADRIIGKDAEKKWSVIRRRQQDKIDFLQNNPDVEGKDLSRNIDGSYRVMSKEERKAAETARNLHSKALKFIRSATAEKKPLRDESL